MAALNLATVALPFIRGAMDAIDTMYDQDPVAKSGMKIAAACAEGCQVTLIEALVEHVRLLEKRLKDEEASSKAAMDYWAAEAENQRLRANEAEAALQRAEQIKVASSAASEAIINHWKGVAEANQDMLTAANQANDEQAAHIERLEERTLAAEAEAERQMRLKEAARAEAEAECGRADDLAEILDNVRRAHAEDVETLRAEISALRTRNAEMFMELRAAQGHQDAPNVPRGGNEPEPIPLVPAGPDLWDEEAHERVFNLEFPVEYYDGYLDASPESRSDEE
jgi:hypothetical protein